MRGAQQLYNTLFAAGCQQFLQIFLYLFQIFSFGQFSAENMTFPPLLRRFWHAKTAPQAFAHGAVLFNGSDPDGCCAYCAEAASSAAISASRSASRFFRSSRTSGRPVPAGISLPMMTFSFSVWDAQQLYNTRFHQECQQFFQYFFVLFAEIILGSFFRAIQSVLTSQSASQTALPYRGACRLAKRDKQSFRFYCQQPSPAIGAAASAQCPLSSCCESL